MKAVDRLIGILNGKNGAMVLEWNLKIWGKSWVIMHYRTRPEGPGFGVCSIDTEDYFDIPPNGHSRPDAVFNVEVDTEGWPER